MDVKQLADLRCVAKAQFERDALVLSQALAKEAELQAALDALAASEARRAAACQGDLEIAFAQTGEALWQGWADKRRRELLSELAHQRAITGEVKARTRDSFGRNSALTDLEVRARARLTEETDKTELQALVDLELGRRWMMALDKRR